MSMRELRETILEQIDKEETSSVWEQENKLTKTTYDLLKITLMAICVR